MACDNSNIHEEASTWLSRTLLAFDGRSNNGRLKLKSRFSHCTVNEGVLKTYFQFINGLLERYDMDGIISNRHGNCSLCHTVDHAALEL